MSTKKLFIYCLIGLCFGLFAYYTTQNVHARGTSKESHSAIPIISMEDGLMSADESMGIEQVVTPSLEGIINNFEVLSEINSEHPRGKKAITLNEAWDLAMQYAKEWSDDAEFIYLVSSDARDLDAEELRKKDDVGGQTVEEIQSQLQYRELSLGQDGRRRAWLAFFQSRSKGCELHIEISDGEITYAATDGGYQIRPGLTQKPNIDSNDMVNLALEKISDFRMSTGKGRGYHFAFQMSNGEPEMSIIGSSFENGRIVPLAVEFDPITNDIQVSLLPTANQ